MKKITFIALGVILLFIFYSCNSSPTQHNIPVSGATYNSEFQNPDSILSEYLNGTGFLVNYPGEIFKGLVINSKEVYANPPTHIVRGTLFIYVNNDLIDTIPYGSAYHSAGVIKPSIQGGYIDKPNLYLLKIQNEQNQYLYSGKSMWYLLTTPGVAKIPKISDRNGNGLYENDYINFSYVRKFNNKIIFFGEYYCTNQTYCTFDLNRTYKNYLRRRLNCYGAWTWE